MMRYRSRVARTMHRAMKDAHDLGFIDDATMKEMDANCLVSAERVEPAEIRAIRKHLCVTQSVFAEHLAVTPGLVSKWERGEKKPSGPALKLLSLVKHKGLDAISL